MSNRAFEAQTGVAYVAAKIGVDTGGAFTDFIDVDEHGFKIVKVLSAPDNPARAVLTGLRQLSSSLTDVNIVHGSIVATNARLVIATPEVGAWPERSRRPVAGLTAPGAMR